MEIEFKFQVPPNRLQALKKQISTGDAVRTRLQARYFDTASGALAAHGLVLRLRSEGSRWVQTAKATLPGDGPLRRMEHNIELDLGEEGFHAIPDIQRHAGSPVGKLLKKILKQGDELVEMFATDISRMTRVEQVGETLVELALDVGKVVAGHGDGDSGLVRESPVCELELELIKGEVNDLVTLAGHWSQRHDLWLSTLSKAERGSRLVSQVAPAAIKAVLPTFSKVRGHVPSAAQVQRAVLAACLAQVLPNASEVAAGVEAPESVHQLRVGLRRLRTALRELDGLGGSRGHGAKGDGTEARELQETSDFDPAWEAALTRVFGLLGAHRDSHLLLDDLQPRLRQAGAPLINLPGLVEGGASVGDAVREAGFQATLVALIGFTESSSRNVMPVAADKERGKGKGDADIARGALRKRLNKLYRQILRDGGRFKLLAPEEQHRVRKRLKRLRYLSEFVRPLFGDKAVARFVAHLVPAQDALGALNDEAVAVERYRLASQADPRAWFAVGWLCAGHANKVDDCHRQLVKLGKVTVFWGKY